jgi:hypothetical protein
LTLFCCCPSEHKTVHSTSIVFSNAGTDSSQGSWEDALRVAKAHGGAAATKQVAYAWAVAVPPEEGGALLRRLGLGDAAVDAAAEAGAFGHAFQLAQVRKVILA